MLHSRLTHGMITHFESAMYNLKYKKNSFSNISVFLENDLLVLQYNFFYTNMLREDYGQDLHKKCVDSEKYSCEQ